MSHAGVPWRLGESTAIQNAPFPSWKPTNDHRVSPTVVEPKVLILSGFTDRIPIFSRISLGTGSIPDAVVAGTCVGVTGWETGWVCVHAARVTTRAKTRPE